MSDWLLNLPVLWMADVVFASIYLFAASIYWRLRPRHCSAIAGRGSRRQPHAPENAGAITFALGTTLPSADKARDAMPVASGRR